jgi:NTE family protein
MIQRRHKSPTYVAPAPISVRGLSGTGLVLSGGGACGAWEAGALKALAELGARFEAVSGASVGALNGAVASAARDAGEAASRLEVAWSRLGEVGLLRPNLETAWKALARLVAAGLEGPAASGWGLRRAVLDVLSLVSDGGLLSDGPLRGLLDRWCGDDELERGLPLHVSLYGDQARGAGAALGEFLLARYGDQDTRKPVFALVQDLPRPFRKEAILASAALPFLFGAAGWGAWRSETAAWGAGGAARATSRPARCWRAAD